VLFVHVGDVGLTSFTSGFASESTSKLDSLDSCTEWMVSLNPTEIQILQIEYAISQVVMHC